MMGFKPRFKLAPESRSSKAAVIKGGRLGQPPFPRLYSVKPQESVVTFVLESLSLLMNEGESNPLLHGRFVR